MVEVVQPLTTPRRTVHGVDSTVDLTGPSSGWCELVGGGQSETDSWGTRQEKYARHLAADLGVADFVYHPTTVSTGQRTREISDGLLISGESGLILQVKARTPDAASGDDPERAGRWLRKNATAAE